ncbi:maleylpyruvate isomerase family mycothiol-dependent enzyme [soil metagenome]
MTMTSDRFRSLAAGFAARVEAVPEDRWSDPSPCDEWTARDVVAHVVQGPGLFFGLVDRELPPGPSVVDDPAAAWAAARDSLQAGLDDPAVAQLEFEGEMGQATFEMAINRFFCTDVLIHTWDLARATGLDERLDPEVVHDVLEGIRPMDEVLRASGAFGPKLDPPDGADEQTQLLAFLGRRA